MKNSSLGVIAMAVAVTSCSSSVAEADPLLAEAIDWYTGVAGHVDDNRARALLEEAAQDGDPISVMWIARVHSRGRMGFEQDEDRARTLAASVIAEIEAAADAGVTEAVFLMGTAFDEGLGKEADPVRAAAWHRRAAEMDHVLGQHNLGNNYAAGRGVAEDPAAAVEWWTRAAERGDAITQLRLGEAYEGGRGVEADLETALAWYRRAAEAGNSAAQEAVDRLTGESASSP